ncbi:MAG TPA: hypothetical protein VM686_14390 [Polyangiaceae bacterium]|nr:hypothetical protein [Polyangiaceae bacterium]
MTFIDTETLRRLFPEVVRDIIPTLPPEQQESVLTELQKRAQAFLGASTADANGSSFLNLIGLNPGGPLSFASDGFAVPEVKGDFDESVVQTQLNSAADLYTIYQYERMKVFQVAGTLIRLFHDGRIRVQSGPGARALYLLEKHFPLRYKQRDRMLAYRRVFNYGSQAAPAGAVVYQNFHRQFVAFTSAIAQYFRDLLIGEVIRGSQLINQRPFGSQATIERLGIDLRWHIDRASFGNIVALTMETSEYLKTVLDTLETPDIKKAFDANNKWDVVEEVSKRFLGGAAEISNRSRMADAGRELLRYVANSRFRTPSYRDFQVEIQPLGTVAEAWIAAYRTTREGRNFPGVVGSIQNLIGGGRAQQSAA